MTGPILPYRPSNMKESESGHNGDEEDEEEEVDETVGLLQLLGNSAHQL